ncbi:MAG: CBS domain-containing protein [Nitrospirae bacterium]|nr:CBS domain-containing protein [Nitrospirota bacterium]MBF0540055.1 CBS domain-containing protein [Nitrospirota bacterium]
MVIITCHTNADFDCLSSMVGIKKLFPEGIIVFAGSQERTVIEFLKTYPIEFQRYKDIDLSKISRLIIVDTHSQHRIGKFKEIIQKKGVQTFIYDHHARKKGDIHGTFETIKDVGATATLITEILRDKKIKITPIEATLLCLGIYEETGSLIFASTTEYDLMAAAYLLKHGANLNIVSNYLKPAMSLEDLALLNELVSSLTEEQVHGIRIKIGVAYRVRYIIDIAHLAHNIMDMEEMDALIIIVNMDGKILIVARSKTKELNVSALLSHYGGGGHSAAASATIGNEMSLDVLKDDIIEKLYETVSPSTTAENVMTSPVITITHNASIKDASKILTRYGINVLPVMKNNKYIGQISRENIEKALFHGFSGSTVSTFTTTDALTTTLQTPIKDIEDLMIEQNQRFMPVIENGAVIGVITRTDLLRTIYEKYLRGSSIEDDTPTPKHVSARNITSVMNERLPLRILDILITAGQAADEIGMEAYLVGGLVRDLLRARRNLDIDIVVEGDGIAFAEIMAQRLEGRLVTHKRFQTAKITNLKGLDEIDIATARTEYYESPAALPTVETSSIKKDLYRRDFTINTLAIKLNKLDFGRLIDFFGARADIRDKTIRVLHNLSFIEDPTRAFRAVRFSERFRFKISKHTINLIKSAVKFDLFEKLSGSRLYDELILIFTETDAVRAVKRLNKYGLLRVIHPKLLYDEQMIELLQNIHDTLSWYKLSYIGSDINVGMLYLQSLVSTLNQEDRQTALDRLSTPPMIMEIIVKGLDKYLEIEANINPKDPVSIYDLLKNIGIETILFVMASCKNVEKQRALSRYLLEYRDIIPMLKGRDLIEMGLMPGPIFSEIFEGIIHKRIEGIILDIEGEIDFVKTRYL